MLKASVASWSWLCSLLALTVPLGVEGSTFPAWGFPGFTPKSLAYNDPLTRVGPTKLESNDGLGVKTPGRLGFDSQFYYGSFG